MFPGFDFPLSSSVMNHQLLKEVSRSFYLSLRFLPPGFREAAGCGYLLARLSDTIADAGEASVEERSGSLWVFRQVLAGLEEVRTLDRTLRASPALSRGFSEGERVLVERVEEVFVFLETLSEERQAAVRRVVDLITEGQSWDLERFDRKERVILSSDKELQGYTYQVAGCVGEFWTELGLGLSPGSPEEFSRLSANEMMRLGRSYGQGLQLINILRDLGEDLKIGRCYLPGGPTEEERGRWLERAREHLDDAEKYCKALRGRRLRFSSMLPYRIGRDTLDLIEASPLEERVKVSRRRVSYQMRAAAQFALWSD